jgi:hypothetical protein
MVILTSSSVISSPTQRVSFASSHDESLTEVEAINILWTGLGMTSYEQALP